MDIKGFCIECHETAEEHGFWPEEGRNFAEAVMLIVTELGEMVEAHRHNNWNHAPGSGGVIEELVDTWIRLGDLTAGFLKERFGDDCYIMDSFIWHLTRKMEYNKARPHKHGKEH